MDGPRNIGKVLRSMQTMEGAGVRLRANLPASRKMMDPRYRGVKAGDIPVVEQEGGPGSGSYRGRWTGRRARSGRS